VTALTAPGSGREGNRKLNKEISAMELSYRYQASAHWIAARHGVVEAENIPDKIYFAPPPEFEGEGDKWTPEHLLVAALSSCFVATFRAFAEFAKFDAVALAVTCEGVLTKEQGGYRFTQVFVRPVLTIAHEGDRERGLRLLQKTERACFISRSLNSKITLEPTVKLVRAAVA